LVVGWTGKEMTEQNRRHADRVASE